MARIKEEIIELRIPPGSGERTVSAERALKIRPTNLLAMRILSPSEEITLEHAVRFSRGNGQWSRRCRMRLLPSKSRSDGWAGRCAYAWLPRRHLEEMSPTEELQVQVEVQVAGEVTLMALVFLTVWLLVEEEATAEGLAAGEHGKLDCPQLAADIEWHQKRAAELELIKRGCGEGSGGLDLGGGLGQVADEDRDDAEDLCTDIDFWISMNEKDLEDAEKEFKEKGCDRPSV